jgi:hypothetical protein
MNLRDRYREWLEQPNAEVGFLEAPFSGTREQLEQIAARTFASENVDYHIETLEDGNFAVFIDAKKPAKTERPGFWSWFWRKK